MNNPTLTTKQEGDTKVMTLSPSAYMKITGGIVLAAFALGEGLRWYILSDSMIPGSPTLGRLNLMMNLFALILCYVIFAIALNSKRIEIGKDRVRILAKPLPFFGNRDFSRTEVREVLIKKNKHYPAESDSLFRTEVHLRLADGQTKPFILAIRPKAKALDIKRWMERELALSPSPEEI